MRNVPFDGGVLKWEGVIIEVIAVILSPRSCSVGADIGGGGVTGLVGGNGDEALDEPSLAAGGVSLSSFSGRLPGGSDEFSLSGRRCMRLDRKPEKRFERP